MYFQTSQKTRKALNIEKNPRVSFVIGLSADDLKTVQYEGIARRISETAELDICKKLFVEKKSPTTEEYFNRSATIFFKVRPTWIDYSDYLQAKPEVIELEEF